MNPTSKRQLATIELGEGVQGTFAWRQGVDRVVGIPCGIMIQHPCADGRRHTMLALWAEIGAPDKGATQAIQQERVTLETLKPLTIVEPLRCGGDCPLAGRIIENRWVPDA